MTTNATTADDRTDALTRALLAEGWTYTREVRTEAQWRSQIYELESPDRRLHLNASRYPDGSMIARLSAESAHTDPGRAPGWIADLHEVPLTAALAVIKAATPALSEDVASTLAAEGWTQQQDITEHDGRLLERAWESPDESRTVVWWPADQFDLGGWEITRPGPKGPASTSLASQFTPAPVLTALALAD